MPHKGVFIVMSVLWGWMVAGKSPSLFEWIGAGICLVGVTVMLLGSK